MAAKKALLLGVLALVIIMSNVVGLGGLGKASQESNMVQPLTSTPLNLSVRLNAAGATFPNPLINQTWAPQYHGSHPNVTLHYDSIGSGGGQSRLINKTIDFAGSDAPLTPAQRILAPNVLHIPETIGSVVAAYNVTGPGIPAGTHLNFTGLVLANIYGGSITVWNDPQIANINKGVTLPANPITTVHRKDSSGTTFVWSSFLCAASTPVCTQIGGASTLPTWPNGVAAQGNQKIADFVRSTPNTIGYVELQYALSSTLSYGQVQNPATNFILPSLTTTKYAVANSTGTLPPGNGDWSGVSLLNAGGPQTYPIASFTYFLVYRELNVVPSMDLVDQIQKKALIDFLNWVVTTGQTCPGVTCPENQNYVQLPPSVVALDQQTINMITYTEISTPAIRNIGVSASSTTGWNPTSITIVSGDNVTLSLTSTDGAAHQWYIDISNIGALAANDSIVSPVFSSPTTPITYSFIPHIWNQSSLPGAGTYTYRDVNNAAITGSITVLPQQVAGVFKMANTLKPTISGGLPNPTPSIDTTRVGTIGTLVIDVRTNMGQGNITIAAVDKTSAASTFTKNYLLSGLLLRVVSGQSGIQVRFGLNVGVSPNALSSNVLVQLIGTTATVTNTLTRNINIGGSGTVNINDVTAVLNAYGTSIGQPGYSAAVDLNGDGTVNILDVGPLLANYGAQYFK